ncbi:MAG: hypothetical protein IJB73_03685 [Firmicutes bacterium]|nr:hypothetical protein [Bacillota bacterium]
MKKFLCLLLTLTLILGLGGCMYAQEGIIINEDGSGAIASTVLFEKEAYDAINAKLVEQGYSKVDAFEGQMPEVVVIDGIEYYCTDTVETFSSLEELEAVLAASYEDVYVSETGVRAVMRQEMDMTYEEIQAAYDELGVDLKSVMTGSILITMPDTIIKCSEGGEISEDGLTATFTFDFEQMCQTQDIMVSTAEETVKPSMTVTHKKTYKNAKTVTVKDESGIKEAKYKKKGGEYVPFDISTTFTKNGTYTVTAKDYYGNKRTRTFTIDDETKPKVKGVSNKKTYTTARELSFSDNCGVSSVTIYQDGIKTRIPKDKIAEGYMVVLPADYKIYIKDINGNSRTVKFTIE